MLKNLLTKFLFLFFIVMFPSFSDGAESPDKAAETFFYRCAGCHTVGNGKLSGPDLITATKWPDADLSGAVKKMEKNVGALTDEDVARLVEFLKDVGVSDRISKQKQRIEASFQKELPAPSFEKGQQLFTGQKPLINGGVACIGCHQFEGEGGSLGPNLSGVKNKSSIVVLQSGIENASYKIMQPFYEKHKITKEEALHLAEYLSHPEKVKARFIPTKEMITFWAGIGFGLYGVLLWRLNLQRKGNTRDKLFKKFTKG